MSRWLLINGSPRLNGESARIVRMMKMQLETHHPDIAFEEVEVGRCDIAGCNGCDYCKTADECIIDDDMSQVIESFQNADRVVLVTPLYFAGVPSQLKALLDRFQQLYWQYCEDRRAATLPPKRPATLVIVGDGGDPFGYEHAVALVKSALAIPGFRVEKVIPLIGVKRLKSADLGDWGDWNRE